MPRFLVNNEFSCEEALISHECSCSALDVEHYLHDCEEDSLVRHDYAVGS